MTPKEAKAYIDRQHRQHRAQKSGIAHDFWTLHASTADRICEAVEAMNGRIWTRRISLRHDHPLSGTMWSEPRALHYIVAFIPDPDDWPLDYIPPCYQP